MCVTCSFVNPFGGDWLHAPEGSRTLSEGTEVPDGVSTTVELSPGDTFSGSLSYPGDSDWFYVEYEAGVTYTITMAPGTMDDPLIFLADANGSIIDEIDDWGSGQAETFVFTALENGSGYVIADSWWHHYTQIEDTGTYSLSITSEPSGQPGANDPLDAIAWNYTAPSVINVYFVPGGVNFVDDMFGGQVTSTWSAFEIQQAQLAFDTFEAVANVTFNYVTNPAQADFFMVEATDQESLLGYWGVGGGTATLNSTSYDLDGWGVFFNGGQGWDTTGLAQGGMGFVTLIHEIGHGMGLAHPHDDGGGSTVMAGVSSAFGDFGDFDLNQGIYTTMSYNDGWQTAPHGTPASMDYGWQGTPMALDIAVLQATYGANTNTNAGNNTYVLAELNAAGSFYSAIWDAGGTDSIQHSGSLAAVIDLRSAPLVYQENGGGFVSYVRGIHGGFTIAANVVIENATGGSGNDTLIGNSAANTLDGGNGDDTLDGGEGDDTLDGGDGNDTIYGGSGNDNLTAGDGDDILVGGEGDDDFHDDWSGNDHFDGGLGFDRLFTLDQGATSGAIIDVEAGTITSRFYPPAWSDVPEQDEIDTFTSIEGFGGTDQDDTFLGSDFDEVFYGNGGDDSASGGAGDDTLNGGNGNDTLDGGEGDDSLTGGAGADTASYASATAAVTVSLALTTAQNTVGAGTDTLTTIENLTGSGFNDTLTGNVAANTILGGAGNDIINGGKGHDTLEGGAGDDIIIGGDGTDTASYASATAAVTVSLALTTAQNTVGAGTDTLTAIASLQGSGFNDILTGNSAYNTLNGGAGNDIMIGGAGNDTYYVDATGDRVFETTTTASSIDAGGTDRIFSTVSLNLDAYNGVKHVEHLTLQGSDNIVGYGNSLNNSITGNSGNNILKGGAGNDSLIGNAGADTFEGGDGCDYMYAGIDDDRDTFIFRSIAETVNGAQRDQIYQFESGEDRIDLGLIDANTIFSGDQSFNFSSSGAAAHSVWIADSGSNVLVRGDVNGDNIYDFEILVASVDSLYAFDFIL